MIFNIEARTMEINNVSASYNKLTGAADEAVGTLTQPRKMPNDNFTDAITAVYEVRALATDVMINVNVAVSQSRTRESLVNNLY